MRIIQSIEEFQCHKDSLVFGLYPWESHIPGVYGNSISFNNFDIIGIDFNFKLSEIKFDQCIFRSCVFSGDLISLDFRECEFIDCEFVGMKFECVVMKYIKFNGCKFKDIKFKNVKISNYDMRGGGFIGFHWVSSMFKDGKFVDVRFDKGVLNSRNMVDGGYLFCIDFDNCSLCHTTFYECGVSAKFSGSMIDITFHSCNEKLELKNTVMRHVIFSRGGGEYVMSNVNWVEGSISGYMKISDSIIKKVFMTGIRGDIKTSSFDGCDIMDTKDVDFSSCNFSYINFKNFAYINSNMKFSNCEFSDIRAINAYFSGSRFFWCTFKKGEENYFTNYGVWRLADFNGAIFEQCKFIEVLFERCNFSMARYERCDWVDCEFSQCNFSNATICNSNGSGNIFNPRFNTYNINISYSSFANDERDGVHISNRSPQEIEPVIINSIIISNNITINDYKKEYEVNKKETIIKYCKSWKDNWDVEDIAELSQYILDNINNINIDYANNLILEIMS